jgi:hypothetical protein
MSGNGESGAAAGLGVGASGLGGPARERAGAGWEPLGDPPPEDLADARLQLHWAIQLIPAFGEALVTSRPDYSHTAAIWDPGRRAFSSEESDDGSRLRLCLQPAGLVFRFLAGGAETGEPFALAGRRLTEAHAWLQAELSGLPAEGAAVLRPLSPEIPPHAVGTGAPFDADPAALAELGRWYHDAHLSRCWPHHFDIATLIALDAGVDEEEARSVGAGMTPGDESYAEPYWYVTPWPYPDDPALPELPSPGRWHTEGWLGAVLVGSDLVAAERPGAAQAGRGAAQAGRGAAQEGLAAGFLDASIAACRELLAG